MVESDVEVFVKEERRSEPITVPLQSSSGGGLQPLYFVVSHFRLRRSRNKIPEGIYKLFYVKNQASGDGIDDTRGSRLQICGMMLSDFMGLLFSARCAHEVIL
jgi:hypothetical protein